MIHGLLCSGAHPGFGVVCGQISGNLEAVDVEGRTMRPRWDRVRQQVAERGLDGLLDRVFAGYCETTPSGGLHTFWRCPDGVEGSQKLAQTPGPPDDQGRPTVLSLIETRGKGGFCVVAPTEGYHLLSGGPDTVAEVIATERAALLELFRTAHELPPAPPRTDHPAGPPRADRIGDQFTAETTWAQVLEPHGWVQVGVGGRGETLWRRPGKDHGWSATTNATGRDTLHVFSTSTPFTTSSTSYDRFAAYAVLTHGGDFTAAAQALAQAQFAELSGGRATPPPAAVDPGTGQIHTAAPASEPTDEAPAAASDGLPLSRADQLRAALLDTDGVDNIPDPEPLIDGLLDLDSLGWLYGQPGSLKSLVALDWAGCIATGKPWQSLPVTHGPVLYIVAEGVRGLGKRKRAWEHAWQRKMTGVSFLPVAVQMLEADDLTALVEVVTEQQYTLIILDTQARLTIGAEENSNSDMGRFVAAADRLRVATGACVLTVHHSPKDGHDLRGASAIRGAADTVIKAVRDGPRVDLLNTQPHGKQKNRDKHPPISLRLAPALDSVVVESVSPLQRPATQLTASDAKVLDALQTTFGGHGTSVAALHDATGQSRSTIYDAVRRLLAHGLVRNIGGPARALYEPVPDMQIEISA